MKILSSQQIRQADEFTLENEPIRSINLMERAATVCVNWILKNTRKEQKVCVYCGTGNNGGDGLAIARLLFERNINVEAIIIRHTKDCTEDFKINYERLLKVPQMTIHNIYEGDDLPLIKRHYVVVDALIGSGLNKPLKGTLVDVVNHINQSGALTISVDIPSGLFCEENKDVESHAIVKADYTLSFQFPKLSFMFAEHDPYVGTWEILPIGIHYEFIRDVKVDNYLIDDKICKSIWKPRNKFASKRDFGHALLVSGSFGMMGAAILAARSCLRSGAGLLTTHVPRSGFTIMQTAVPESIISVDSSEENVSDIANDLSHYTAMAIGPGIGTSEATQKALKSLLQSTRRPMLLDADAINILAENKDWISLIPENSILTPHLREFQRLVGQVENAYERNQIQREFSKKYKIYVVLKGAHTAITCPDGTCYFNNTGNPGMATAGSGDVLTGVILGLLAQGYDSKEACILGAYAHGLAGDIHAKFNGQETLIASDIINKLGKAFLNLSNSSYHQGYSQSHMED